MSGTQDAVPANDPDLTWTASITWDGGTGVSATINGITINGTLAPGDVAALTQAEPATGFGFNAAVSMDDSKVTHTGTGPAMMINAYNASVSGSVTSGGLYDVQHGALPVAPDLVFISYSHNRGTDTPALFTGKIDALVTQIRALYPDAGLVLSSQNPKIYPGANRSEHLPRLVAVRGHARKRRYGYVAALERFLAQPSVPALLNADGIHPVAAGSVVWRDAALAYLNSLQPAA